ncbi:MAG: CDP-glycerol glycerophosphotransferase family protein [Deltaproteobacteria bacterium]|nr:CDP-glycerol glycerophosphotransferase family protein [Deltaproteobacteria bacterium]
MAGKIISFGLTPLRPGDVLVATPTRINFVVSRDAASAPSAFDPASPLWQFRQASGNLTKTNDLFNHLQDARIAGRTILEFVQYRGISMWQFLPSYLWPAFFRAVELIDLLPPLLDETSPRLIRIFPAADYTDSIWQGVIQARGRQRGLPVITVQSPKPASYLPESHRRVLLLRFGISPQKAHRLDRAVSTWCGRVLDRWQRSRTGGHAGGKKLLFATQARYWVKMPGEPAKNYDEQLFPLLPALRAAGWTRIVGLDCPYTRSWEILPTLWERVRTREAGLRWNTFYAYESGREEPAAAQAAFDRQWQLLERDPDFQADFSYGGVPLMPALRQELERAFRRILPECASMLATAGKILAQEQPDALMATYEQGPFQRALIIKAAQAGIPTVGLQHGLIYENNYDYCHRRVAPDPQANSKGFAVPGITCVWGPFFQKKLVESCHYPSTAVAVTGNWRYDRLLTMEKTTDPNALKLRFGVPPGKKLVLILSGGQKTVDYLDVCLKAIAARGDCVPLIKIHPGADDPKPVRELLQALGYPAATLIADQLFEPLMAADLVISQFSTVVSDAAFFDRPIVLVNFLNLDYPQHYHEAGICLYVTRPQELATAIELTLNDRQVRERLQKARRLFIADYFSRTDGRAAARVVAALEESLARRHSKPLE